MNMIVCVVFSLNMLIKTTMNLFYEHESKNKSKIFSHNKLKLQPRC